MEVGLSLNVLVRTSGQLLAHKLIRFSDRLARFLNYSFSDNIRLRNAIASQLHRQLSAFFEFHKLRSLS